MRRTCLILLLTMAAAACRGGEKPAEQATAGGEILQGSVSDAMLPLDQVRSQPPLAPKASGTAAKDGGDDVVEPTDAATDSGPGEPPTGDTGTSGEGGGTTPGAE
jgi:hypothetical protein